MKTPEELAEEYADDLAEDFNRLFPDDAAQPFIETFLAGYKAAQETYEARIKELEQAIIQSVNAMAGVKYENENT